VVVVVLESLVQSILTFHSANSHSSAVLSNTSNTAATEAGSRGVCLVSTTAIWLFSYLRKCRAVKPMLT
jgi:hypothetical protein